MKKILSIFGTVSLTTTASSSVISCGNKKPTPVNTTPQQEPTPVDTTQTNLIEKIKNEQKMKMEYFNQLNSKSKKYRIELGKRINILENKNKDLEQEQTSIKKDIQQLQQEIEELNNQVGKNGNEAMELEWQKRLKLGLNNKNNKILESIIKQIKENKIEIEQLKTQKSSEKFDISQLDSIISPNKIKISKTQKEGNKIYALEKDINKMVLKQIQEKINDTLELNDFLIEFEDEYKLSSGITAIELSHPKTIKIKIHSRHNTVGETSWISINLPQATIV